MDMRDAWYTHCHIILLLPWRRRYLAVVDLGPWNHV